MVRPFDPRLVRHARATGVFLAGSVAVGVATTGLVIAQAVVLADILSRAFLGGADLAALRKPLLLLAAVVTGRGVLAWAQEVFAHRSSAAVKSQLRRALLDHVLRLGPAWLSRAHAGELATLVTRGVDALDGYFSRYLPQLVLAAVVPPAVVAWILGCDWTSALVVAVTLPLVPVFMVLIGLYTQRAVDRQWRVLSQLAGHFLDVVAGLPTLKVFGRAKAQAATIGRVTGEYRRATLATLRVAFLSSLVLEVLSTLSVALVAVSVGLRLVGGEVDLRTALVVVVLAPEAYLPLRQVGAQFHASAEGLAAAERVFDVLDTALPKAGGRQDPPDPAAVPLHVEGVTVRYEGRQAVALDRVSLTILPGRVTALVGPSGCGKSTLLAVLLGFVRPDEGRVRVGDVDLAEVDARTWRQRVAWVPQRPHLVAGSVGDNVRFGSGNPPAAVVERALRAAGLPPEALPRGLDTAVGEDGAGLSAGQRQRVALARAFLRDVPLVLLDEPTAHLDPDSEAVVLDTLRRLAREQNRTVVVVAHRPSIASVADAVVWLAGGQPADRRHRVDRGADSACGARAAGAAGAGAVAGEGAAADVHARAHPGRAVTVPAADVSTGGVSGWTGHGDTATAYSTVAVCDGAAAVAGPASAASGAACTTTPVAAAPATPDIPPPARPGGTSPVGMVAACQQDVPEGRRHLWTKPVPVDNAGPAGAGLGSAPPPVREGSVPPLCGDEPAATPRRSANPRSQTDPQAAHGRRPRRGHQQGSLSSPAASAAVVCGPSARRGGAGAARPARATPPSGGQQDHERRARLRQLAALARPVSGRLALAVLAGAAALGCAVGLAATSAWLISRAAEHPPVLYLMVAIAAVRAFGLGRGVLRYLERLLAHDAALRVLAALRVRVYRHLERLAPAGLPAFRSGDLLGRLVSDVDDVQDILLRVLVPGAVAVVVGAASVALVWSLLPAAGMILLATLLLAGLGVPWLAARTARVTEHRLADLRRALSAAVVDMLHGAPELVVYGEDRNALAGVADLDRELTRAAGSSARTGGLGAGLSAAAAGLAVLGSVLVAVPAVRAGSLDGVLLAVVALVPIAAFELVSGLSAAAQQLQRATRSTARVLDVLHTAVPVAEPAHPQELPAPPYPLRVRGLRVCWPNAARPALDGVDLDLGPGRRVAVVGPSGAGKSTLAAVLLRFLEPQGGSVLIGGVATRELHGDDVRRVVGLCAQDAYLFDSTIAENVRLARPAATDTEIDEVLRRAGLGEWLDALPHGLHTPVGEHGAQVSGGQRQRIALARALLADFPILLADEPTANLDVPTADALTADLLAARPGRATLLVTHRLSGLDAVDEIVVLVGGRVAQRGTHTQLVSCPGPYQRMWRREREYDDLLGHVGRGGQPPR